jgi:hypothetical protein
MAAIVFFDQSERKIDSRTGTGRRVKGAIFNEMPSGINPQILRNIVLHRLRNASE